MSKNQSILNEENLKKFDEFIQDTLNKYFYVKPWKELYDITGKNHNKIISNKSTIPDLVIYNKGFNKLDCFYFPNEKKQKVIFPRKQFILRPKKVKDYDSKSQYIKYESNKEEKKEEEKKEKEEKPFEFKSIPKEIENKYIGNDKKEENKVYDELNDFMGKGKDNKSKVELIKENKIENIDDKNKRKYSSNIEYNFKNKFSFPNNYEEFIKKMNQNMQFPQYFMGINNNFQKININELKNEEQEDETKSIKIFSNINIDDNLDNYFKNADSILKKNIKERIWVVMNNKSRFFHKYNHEELYYFLSSILKTEEKNNYSIYCKYFDMPFAHVQIYERLKELFSKEKSE